MEIKPSLWDIYNNYLLEKRPSKDTARSYKYVVKIFIKDTLITHPSDIQRHQLIRWRNLVLDRATITTWNSYLRQLRALCNHGIQAQLITENPFLEVDFLKALKKLKKTIEKGTYLDVISLIKEEESKTFEPSWFWLLLLRTLHRTGMRRRQVVGLRWPDLSFEEKTLKLRAESSKSRREWKIPMADLDDDFKSLRTLTARLVSPDYFKSGQVFNWALFNPRLESEELSVDQVSRFFRTLKNHMPPDQPISPHRLRHTFGTEATKDGDIKTVQEFMGHTDIRTTSEYVHPDIERMRDVIKHWDE